MYGRPAAKGNHSSHGDCESELMMRTLSPCSALNVAYGKIELSAVVAGTCVGTEVAGVALVWPRSDRLCPPPAQFWIGISSLLALEDKAPAVATSKGVLCGEGLA